MYIVQFTSGSIQDLLFSVRSWRCSQLDLVYTLICLVSRRPMGWQRLRSCNAVAESAKRCGTCGPVQETKSQTAFVQSRKGDSLW